MNLNGTSIANENLAEAFADMFEIKVKDIVTTTSIEANVYNGYKKITVEDKNFMTPANIISAIKSLKLKNSEGFDRIPQRILIDGMSALINPFSTLFNLIYLTNEIPEQWSMSKITDSSL